MPRRRGVKSLLRSGSLTEKRGKEGRGEGEGSYTNQKKARKREMLWYPRLLFLLSLFPRWLNKKKKREGAHDQGDKKDP